MTRQTTKFDLGKLCKTLDPGDSGWVECNQLERALLDLGYPPRQVEDMFDYAGMNSDEGKVPILPFFVTLKRSGLLVMPSLRFSMGTRVLVRDGPRPRDWFAGTIIQLNTRDPQWLRGKMVPYQVALDDGRLIYVDEDEPSWCRELIPPWWHDFQGFSATDVQNASIGQDLNEQRYDGVTFLHSAASMSLAEVVDELIKLRADVDIIDHSHATALHKAVQAPDAQALVQMICAARADVNCQDLNPNYDPEFSSATFVGHDLESHRTPLHYSSERGDVDTMQVLIEWQSDVNIQDGELNTPLHLAIHEDRNDAIDVLLHSGADLNLGNMELRMNSPLMYAAYHNKFDLATKLIESRADINQQGKSDMTALHLAARSGNAMIARMLVSARADPTQKSTCGTALDLAITNGKRELLLVLRAATSQGVEDAGGAQEIFSVTQMDASQRSSLFID